MSSTVFTPPVQRALRADVYDAIRKAIMTGSLKPGEKINEADIARQMQISRAPVREAIRQLDQEGLLVSIPRRGTSVVSLSRSDVEEVYTLRANTESLAVRRAISRLDQEQFATMDGLLAEMRAAADEGDVARLLEGDIQFHRTIVDAAGWPRLKKIWESLHPQTLTLYTLTTLTDWPPSVHAQRHEPLLDALRSGDADVATAAIEEHILGISDQVINRLPD